MRNNIIKAVIVTGPAFARVALISRISMIPADLLVKYKRFQFQVIPS